MYNGKVSKLPRVFAKLGFPVPSLSNPADYVILLAQTIDDDGKLPRYNEDQGIVDLEMPEKSPNEPYEQTVQVNSKTTSKLLCSFRF